MTNAKSLKPSNSDSLSCREKERDGKTDNVKTMVFIFNKWLKTVQYPSVTAGTAGHLGNRISKKLQQLK